MKEVMITGPRQSGKTTMLRNMGVKALKEGLKVFVVGFTKNVSVEIKRQIEREMDGYTYFMKDYSIHDTIKGHSCDVMLMDEIGHMPASKIKEFEFACKSIIYKTEEKGTKLQMGSFSTKCGVCALIGTPCRKHRK